MTEQDRIEGERCARIVRDAFESLFGLERGPTTLTRLDVNGNPYSEVVSSDYFHSPGAAAAWLLSALVPFHWGAIVAGGAPRTVHWRIEPKIARVEGVRHAEGPDPKLWRAYARLTVS